MSGFPDLLFTTAKLNKASFASQRSRLAQKSVVLDYERNLAAIGHGRKTTDKEAERAMSVAKQCESNARSSTARKL